MGPQGTRADLAYVAFRRTGDPRELGLLYDEVAPELLRVALHLTRDAAEAEDVLQATFLAAIERAPSFDPARPVLPWLAGILAREAKKSAERARRAPDPARLDSARAASPEDDAQRAELLEHLDAALASLPEAFRPVLILRVRHALSATEIAAVLGRPPGTVRSQLARGLDALRRALPASLAGALLATSLAPTRGLAAVRDAVLAHASLAPVAGATVPVLVRILAMKKLAALALVSAVAAVWLAWPRADAAHAPERASDVAVARAAAPAPRPPDAPRSSEDGSDAARVEAVGGPAARSARPARTDPTQTALRVLALTEDTGAPVEGEIVLVRAAGDPNRSDDARVTSTDARGVARFAPLPPGSAYVRLLRGGEGQVDLALGRESELHLTVKRGVTVDGEVLDGEGRAVGQAEIWLSERFRNNLGHVVTRADARGRFTLAAVGDDFLLGARAPGFAPSGLRSVRGSPGERRSLRLVLEREGVLVRGRVLDERGNGVARAKVLLGDERPLLTERLDDGTLGFGPPPLRAECDANGEFAFEGAPQGLVPLQARAPGFAPFAGEFEIEVGARQPLEVRLERAARVVGSVRDDSGSSLASAWIHAGEPECFAAASTYTSPDGRYELEGLAPGERLVHAEHSAVGRASARLSLAPGETRTWDVVLAQEPRIFGHLRDARGAPLEGWTIVALPHGDTSARTRSQRVEADGAFAIVGLADEPHTLWVQRPEGWREFPVRVVEEVLPSSTPLELEIADVDRDSGRIVARVLGPDRAPLAGAELQVWHTTQHLWRSFLADAQDGALALEHVPPGLCAIEVRHPEHPWMHVGEREVRAGETLDLGELVLQEAGRLRVRVSGLRAEDIARLAPVIASPTGPESGVMRVENGELRSGPLAEGAHVLLVRGDFVAMRRVEVAIRAGAETVLDLALERCGSRVARFELDEGTPSPGWVSCALVAEDGTQVWFGGSGGPQALEARVSAPPGEYQLVANGDGGLAARGAFTISDLAGDEPPLSFALRREP